MKRVVLCCSLLAALLVSACTPVPPVAAGPTTGIKSQSTHDGNSEGSRTDLR